MRLMSRRALAERDALVDRLREALKAAEADLLEVGRVNGRLADASGGAEAALQVEVERLRELCGRQEQEIDQLRKDRNRLAEQVEEFMYTPEQRELIDRGGPAKEGV